jgi:hypothetical protein
LRERAHATTCRGSIALTVQVAGKRHEGNGAVARRATLVLATGFFSVAEGKSRTVVLHATAAGKKLLSHANKHHPLAARLTLSMTGGKATTKPVLAV